MRYPGHTWILAALLLTVAFSSDAHAWQWLTLYPLEAEAILRFDGTDRTSDIGSDGRDIEWRTGVRLSQEGYTIHPGIARYVLQIEPIWTTGFNRIDDITDKRNGNYLNYLISADVFREAASPVGFDVSLSQNEDRNTGSLGSRWDNSIQDYTLGISWFNRPFPMKMKFNSRTFKQKFRAALDAPISERDEKIDTWTIEGRSGKMDILLERQSLNDRIFERNNDYDQTRATLNHAFLWGSNSSLRSYWDYLDRISFNSNRRMRIGENLRIQHTENVYSFTRYNFLSVTQAFKTSEHSGLFELGHKLYSNLNTKGYVWGLTRNSQVQDTTEQRVGIETNYRKGGLPFGVTVSGGIRYAYQLTDRNSKMDLNEVVDEGHTVPLAGDVILTHRFVVLSSIIITDAAGQLVYGLGVDYEVFELPSELTQIQAIPGGRIDTGSNILVSYKSQTLPSQEFSTTFTTVNLGFNLPWMRFSYYDDDQSNKLLSGAGKSFLTDRRDTTTRLDFNWRIFDIDTRISAEKRFTMVNDYEATAYTYSQQLGWAVKGQVTMSLNLMQQFTEATDRDTDLYNMTLAIDWRPMYNLSIRPILGAWKRLDIWKDGIQGERDDVYVMAGVRMRWFYRKVTFDLDLNTNQRTTNELQTKENRLWFNLSRRF